MTAPTTAAPGAAEALGAAARTHCPYCALQCAMSLAPVPEASAAPGGRPALPVEVAPRDFPTNRGGLCQKGWTSASVLRAPDRLTTPLLRGPDGALRPATWDEALDVVAAGIA